MPKKYCVCGFVNEYPYGEVIKTCGACKEPFASAFYVAPKVEEAPKPPKRIKPKALAARAQLEDDDEDEEGENEPYVATPQLTKFEFEVVVAKKTTINDIRAGATPIGLDKNLPNVGN